MQLPVVVLILVEMLLELQLPDIALAQGDAHGEVWFRNSETDALTLVTPEMYPFVMPHGEVGLCDTQLLRDGDRVKKCSQTLVGV